MRRDGKSSHTIWSKCSCRSRELIFGYLPLLAVDLLQCDTRRLRRPSCKVRLINPSQMPVPVSNLFGSSRFVSFLASSRSYEALSSHQQNYISSGKKHKWSQSSLFPTLLLPHLMTQIFQYFPLLLVGVEGAGGGRECPQRAASLLLPFKKGDAHSRSVLSIDKEGKRKKNIATNLKFYFLTYALSVTRRIKSH